MTANSPYVKDPDNPTDAELAAAIQRGLDNGTLIDAADFLAACRGDDDGHLFTADDYRLEAISE